MAAEDTFVITSQQPRLISWVDLIPDWEADADGTDPPTGWGAGGAGAPVHEVDTAQFYNPGSRQYTRSVRLRKDGAANNAFVTYTTAPGTMITGVPWCVVAAVRFGGPSTGVFNFRLDTLDAVGAVQESWAGGAVSGLAANTWHFVEKIVTPDNTASATATKWVLYLVQGTAAPDGEDVWISALRFGPLSDFDRRFSVWTPREQPRVSHSMGVDTDEGVELAKAVGGVRFGHRRVAEATSRELAWGYALHHVRQGRPFALWREADQWQNGRGHYQWARAVREYDFRYRVGLPRTGIQLNASTPLERHVPTYLEQ